MRVVRKQEAAQRLGIAVRSLEDKRYRTRIGLPAVRIGRRIGFDERDLEHIIARGRETLLVISEPEMELIGTAGDKYL